MSKQLLNMAEYAKLHRVSKPAVTRWKDRGWLIFEGGLVDVEASNEMLKQYRRNGANPKVNQPVNGQLTDQVQPGETIEDAANRILKTKATLLSFDEARRMKENYLALLNQLEYEEQSGALVEYEVARNVFFEEFRAIRDAWLNWPTRIGPEIAADLGLDADRVTEIITAHVHKHITALGQPETEFSTKN